MKNHEVSYTYFGKNKKIIEHLLNNCHYYILLQKKVGLLLSQCVSCFGAAIAPKEELNERGVSHVKAKCAYRAGQSPVDLLGHGINNPVRMESPFTRKKP